MNTMIKLGVTAALAVVIAWPLLFWGKPEAGSNGVRKNTTGCPLWVLSARGGLVSDL